MDQCVFIIAHHPGPVGSTSEELSVSLLFFFIVLAGFRCISLTDIQTV